ncbi:MAG: Gfo/Idh/MocA family oxidoreductase [Microscillaceae bacterium]|nr:Gfo/Idh/MocA family oxidoreductase [Microscillaceae bacterium]
MKSKNTRRKFLKKLGGTSAVLASGIIPFSSQAQVIELQPAKTPTPIYNLNDKIRLATIGMGIIGHYDTRTALKVEGTELVAVCDLYDGRLEQAKYVFGKDIKTTRDYREILDRKDIDAVIISTPDHWHSQIAIEALQKGKHIYCEKPMVHQFSQGLDVIEAQKKSGKVLQVGSQRTSSIAMLEAKKLYESGAIGQINSVVARYNRHSSLGAWQYSIPPDASPETVDFDRFLGNAPKVPFDAVRFFRWRNYRDYGTGVPGDLFVHLLSGLHFVTGSLGPNRVMASGQLTYWKDGRDVPDVVSAILEYPDTDKHPAFQAILQVNFADGSGGSESTQIVGSEGVIEIGWGGFTVKKSPLPKAPEYGGYDSLFTFTEKTQKEFIADFNQKYDEADRKASKLDDVVYKTPKGYDDREEHFKGLFTAIREGKTVMQDASFGFRAAAPCLATNMSVFEKKIVEWDPVKMVLKS